MKQLNVRKFDIIDLKYRKHGATRRNFTFFQFFLFSIIYQHLQLRLLRNFFFSVFGKRFALLFCYYLIFLDLKYIYSAINIFWELNCDLGRTAAQSQKL